MVLFLIATFGITILLTRVIMAFARAYDVVDKPNVPRKKHTIPMPLLGGLGIMGGFWVMLGGALLGGFIILPGKYVVALLGATALLGYAGYRDDRFDMSSRYQLLSIIGAALWATLILQINVAVSIPWGGMAVLSAGMSALVTFIWLTGITLVTKILDGLDGLVTGIAAIGGFGIAAFSLATPYFDKQVAMVAAVFAASCLGFLVWNYKPAQIFLGNGGSTWAGFMLAFLALIGGIKFAIAMLVLALPSIDLVYVMIKRLKNGKKPWEGDDSHLHFRLKNYLGDEKTVWVYYGVALLMSLSTLFLSSPQKYALLGVLAVLSVLMVVFVEKWVQKA